MSFSHRSFSRSPGRCYPLLAALTSALFLSALPFAQGRATSQSASSDTDEFRALHR